MGSYTLHSSPSARKRESFTNTIFQSLNRGLQCCCLGLVFVVGEKYSQVVVVLFLDLPDRSFKSCERKCFDGTFFQFRIMGRK